MILPIKGTAHGAVETMDYPVATIGHEGYFTALPRLESDRGAGGNIQSAAARGFPIKIQGRVCFKEMIVTAYLYWAVASVRMVRMMMS